MDPKDLADVVAGAVKSAIKEERASFWVEPEQHYQDHLLLKNCAVHQDEMRANHDFVSGVRKTTGRVTKQMQTITVRVGFTGLLVLIAYAVWEYIKTNFLTNFFQ
ncbi:hypothetical protein KAR91_12215 [Candidatus Pacearchaeota archaeon]|nr:hypothetical protein [Candidatus Pacearchaeota archaeon]